MPNRSVFFVSDGTGITAETFGNSILAQFPAKPRHVRRPFIDSVEKALAVVGEINHVAQSEGRRPIVFITLVDDAVRQILTSDDCRGLVLDMFRTFVEPLEIEFGVKSNHRVGRFSDAAKSSEYNDRIEAINFSLAHDDGQSSRNLASADVILLGVSRSGKTPTSLYLAMQHGIKAANYPLIPEDLEKMKLPPALLPLKHKVWGLTIVPERLQSIRQERKPDSKYASLENCKWEVQAAETLMQNAGVSFLNSTTKSIEELATTILHEARLDRRVY